MPPIPNQLDEETLNLISSLQRRRKDLGEFQIPRLSTCKGPLATQQRYAAELREDLDLFAKQVEVRVHGPPDDPISTPEKNLDIAVDDQRSARSREELRQIVDDFQATLARLRRDARAATLASKRALDANQLSNREELLRSSAITEKQDLNEKVTEDALMKANNNVTEALQRTIGLMQAELERSVLSSQLLDTSSASLRSTSSTHDVLDGLMTTSKHLITALEKSDWLDRLLILAGLVFFILTVLFILKQRLIDRSLRIAFWWTRFIPDFSGDEALLKMEEGSGTVSSLTVAATSVVTTVASSLTLAASVAKSTVVTQATDTPSTHDTLSEILETLSSTTLASMTTTTSLATSPDEKRRDEL